MPMAPANADASTVLAIESWFGDRPASMPYTSFSAAARVARPNRVQRYKAASASAISTTITAIQNRFAGIDVAEDLDEVGGEDAGDLLRRRTEPQQHRRLEGQQDPERGDQLGERRRRSQWAEHEQLAEHARRRSTPAIVTATAGGVASVKWK